MIIFCSANVTKIPKLGNFMPIFFQKKSGEFPRPTL